VTDQITTPETRSRADVRAAFNRLTTALDDLDLRWTSVMCLPGQQISVVVRTGTQDQVHAVFTALDAPPPRVDARSATGGPRLVGPVPAYGLTSLSITLPAPERSNPS
jgi:hypothetical protein